MFVRGPLAGVSVLVVLNVALMHPSDLERVSAWRCSAFVVVS